MLTIVGIVLFVLALLASIALHELGHLSFAKLFNVRTTQYMVGFGKTLWSRQVGETEYGIKAIPLGGYIRMIGMVPPERPGRRRRVVPTTTSSGPMGMVRSIIEETRANDRTQVAETDDGRQFYQLHPAKRIVIMFAGPFMNLLIAVGVFAVVLVGIGVPTPSTTVSTVSACVIPASANPASQRTDCLPADPQTPSAAAGLRPGDEIVGFDGAPVAGWAQLTDLIQASAGRTVQLEYVRDGERVAVAVPIVRTERPVFDDRGQQIGTRPAGFLGISVTRPYTPQTVGAAVAWTGQAIGDAARAVVAIPSRIPALWDAIWNDVDRDLNTPVGIVGAGRLGGDILESENTSTTDKVVLFLNLVAGFNLSLFLINMLPLLPLDGGHILGAVIEWVRRGWAKLRRKPDPGPFDVAVLMPVAYVVALLFIGLTLLTLVADVVNPVRIFG